VLLSVALDGAGWHPAAWREPAACPAGLFGPGYWLDVIADADRVRSHELLAAEWHRRHP
jgi:hypothetical protein